MTTTGRARRRDFVPPRWGTERTDRPTLGPELEEIAQRLSGHSLMPHQRYVADVLGEYEPDPDAPGGIRLVYAGADIGLMRQAGKTLFGFAFLIHRVTKLARRFDTRQQALYTAQRGGDAVGKFEFDLCEMLRARPKHWNETTTRRPRLAREWRWTAANGKENLRVGAQGILYPAAPTRDIGHSKTLDAILLDECFAFSLEEAGHITAGVDPTMATRHCPQAVRISSAGDARSEWWWSIILAGRTSIEAGTASPLAFFEWGVPDDIDPGDEDAWWEYLPALGRTISVEFLRAEYQKALRSATPERSMDLFRRGYLNQWPSVPVLDPTAAVAKILPADRFAACASPTSPIGRQVLGVDVEHDHGSAAISLYAESEVSGRFHVETIEHLSDPAGWLARRVGEIIAAHPIAALTWDAGGHAVKSYDAALRRAAVGVRIDPIPASEYPPAAESFIRQAREKVLAHLGDSPLADAIDGCVPRPVGDGGWVPNRQQSRAPQAPLIAALCAARAFDRLPAPEAPPTKAKVHSF